MAFAGYDVSQWVWLCEFDPAHIFSHPDIDTSSLTAEEEDAAMGIPRIPARVANISASGDQITLHLDWGWVCSKCAQKEEFSADARPDEVTVDATDPNNTLKVKMMDESNIEGRPNMVDLADLKVGELMHNLRIRYERERADPPRPMAYYTYVQEILVVANPMEDKGLVDQAHMDIYHGVPLLDPSVEPHIFAIGDEAYRKMMNPDNPLRPNQSIVISGESGAGKSESTKHVLKYIAHASEKGGDGAHQDGDAAEEADLNDQIIATSEVLEAFGNAKTTRNHNSSRFGKFVKIQFDQAGNTVGVEIVQYLLERSRICQVFPGERNYHCFYLICQFLDQDEKDRLHITNIEDYKYLMGIPGTAAYPCDWQHTAEGEDMGDAHRWEKFIKFIEQLGVSKEDRFVIWRVVAAVMHLGQLEFTRDPSESEETLCTITPAQTVDWIAELLEIPDVDAFRMALLKAKVCNTFKVFQPDQARANADSIAKAIYSRLFEQMVDVLINSKLKQRNFYRWIGVLDIFGFESFQELEDPKTHLCLTRNTFEQLCINLTNEVLQHFFFHELIPKQELHYKEEGVDIGKIEYADNIACVELIMGKIRALESGGDGKRGRRSKKPLLKLLNGASSQAERRVAWFDEPILGDIEWLTGMRAFGLDISEDNHDSVYKKRTEKEEFLGYYNKDSLHDRKQLDFWIYHYAGKTYYTVEGAARKNMDKMSEDSEIVVASSGNPYVHPVEDPAAASSSAAGGSGGGGSGGGSSKFIADNFMSQLNDLYADLSQTHAFFVRCVKANCAMRKGGWLEDRKVLDQLIHAGMYAIIQMRQNGYPVERQQQAFVNQNRFLFENWNEVKGNASLEEQCKIILRHAEERDPERVHGKMAPWTIGTKGNHLVFMKDRMSKALSEYLAEALAVRKSRQIEALNHLIAVYRMAKEYKTIDKTIEAGTRLAQDFALIRYYMETENLTKEQAIARIAEIREAKRLEELRIHRAAHFDPVAARLQQALSTVPALNTKLDELIRTSTDAKEKQKLETRKATLNAQAAKAQQAIAAFDADPFSEKLEQDANGLTTEIAKVAGKEPEKIRKTVARREWLVQEKTRREQAAIEEKRRQHEEAMAKLAEEQKMRLANAVAAEKARQEAARQAVKQARIEKMNKLKIARKLKDIERQKQIEAQRKAAEHKAKMAAKAKRKADRHLARVEARKAARTSALEGTSVKFHDMTCTVRYIGPLPYEGSAEYVGIECPTEVKNGTDGSVLNTFLFHCPPGRALFVRGDMLSLVNPDAINEFAVGQRVWQIGTTRCGTVKHVGEVHFETGVWIGVLLDVVGSGNNNGSIRGRAEPYFEAPPKTGIFVRPEHLTHIAPWTENFVNHVTEVYCLRNDLDDDAESPESESETRRRMAAKIAASDSENPPPPITEFDPNAVNVQIQISLDDAPPELRDDESVFDDVD